MTRTGAGWDVLAAAAVLLPLASLAGRRWAVPGSLAASGLWILLLTAGAAPETGRFTPDLLGLAAAAGTTLLAAALAEAALRAESDRRPTLAVGAGPVAAALCFGIGLVDQPDLSSGPATVLVLAAAAIAALATLGPPPLRLLLPAALLAGLRGSVELVDPTAALGLVLAAAAAVVAAPVRLAGHARPARVLERLGPRGDHEEDRAVRAAPVALALGCLAVAAGPVPAARGAGALLAAVAVLAVAAKLAERPAPTPYVPVHPWLAGELGLAAVEEPDEDVPQAARTAFRTRGAVLLAAAPGASLVVTGLADVPSPGAPSVAVHVVYAALALAVAIVLVLGAGLPAPPASTSTTYRPAPSPVAVAVAALVTWLLLVPGSWRWAVADPDVLAAWERAAAVALAAGGLVVVAMVAASQRRDRSVAPRDR